MRVVPKKIPQKVRFYQLRVARWTDHAAELGLSGEETAALAAKVDVAVAALKAQQAARQAAMAATLALHNAAGALGEYGSALIKKIKARAGQEGSSIYGLASVRPPAQPSPLGPPGTPREFSMTLEQVGVLHLKWKCKNPRGSSGTMYQVWRRIGVSGELVFLGTSGTKSFTDDRLPAGTAEVTYQVQAIRSTAKGQCAEFIVHLGVSGARAGAAARAAGMQPTKVAA